MRPGGVAVRPGLHDQLVRAHLGRRHRARPLVVSGGGEGAGVNDLTALAQQGSGGQHIMAILEDGHPDRHGLAHDSLGGVPMGRGGA